MIVQANGKRTLELFRWALIPWWAKDPAIGNRMINARAETLAGAGRMQRNLSGSEIFSSLVWSRRLEDQLHDEKSKASPDAEVIAEYERKLVNFRAQMKRAFGEFNPGQIFAP